MFPDRTNPRLACDAMCGGLARWLRALGIDASYTLDIDDADLVRHALAECRTVVSSDMRLFHRRLFTAGQLHGLLLPVGLRLAEQIRFAVEQLHLHVTDPRCTLCNGQLVRVAREEVGDVVPALSLLHGRNFHRCTTCRHVFWEGSHWKKITLVRESLLPPTPPGIPSREQKIG